MNTQTPAADAVLSKSEAALKVEAAIAEAGKAIPSPTQPGEPALTPLSTIHRWEGPPGIKGQPLAVGLWPYSTQLKDKAQPVVDITDDHRALLTHMFATMWSSRGMGLAAPQVGVPFRMIVVDTTAMGQTNHGKGVVIALINPVITWKSHRMAKFGEACLSIPGFAADVIRPSAVTVEYTDEDGFPRAITATGGFADCLQHEIDHLDGILYVSHLGKANQALARNATKKFKRHMEKYHKHMRTKAAAEARMLKVEAGKPPGTEASLTPTPAAA